MITFTISLRLAIITLDPKFKELARSRKYHFSHRQNNKQRWQLVWITISIYLILCKYIHITYHMLISCLCYKNQRHVTFVRFHGKDRCQAKFLTYYCLSVIWKTMDLVLDLTLFLFLTLTQTLTQQNYLNPNNQFYQRVSHVEYYSVHAHMVWNQKLRKSGNFAWHWTSRKFGFCNWTLAWYNWVALA